MKDEVDFKIYTDGGSRGNPGEAAYGFVIYDSKNSKLYEEGKRLGIQTNNFAEYSGIKEALKWIENNSKILNPRIKVFMDSKLAVEQLSGHWKIKNETLRNLFYTIKEIEHEIDAKINYSHVFREYNKEADSIVNLALDGKI